MKPTSLEVAVIDRLLSEPSLRPARSSIDNESLEVADRSVSPHGFFLEFERTLALKLFADDVVLRWTAIGARINQTKQEVGFVVSVDGGYLTSLEGFVYGDDVWPQRIDSFEVYEPEVQRPRQS